MEKRTESLFEEKNQILSFLRTRFPLFHNSNFFFRDLQYGLRSYFEKKGTPVTYPQSEKLASEFAEILEKENVFLKINHQSWKVNFPDFVTVQPGDPFQF
ncbi:MAG: hypothetical protein R6W68_00555 [Ignavibacteriaceae bacterium]